MVVVVSGYAFFFIAMKKKTDGAVELLTKIEELSGKNAKLSASVSVLKNEAERVEKLKSYFIKESEIVAFTRSIEALAVLSGVSLSIESLEPGLSDADMPVLNFRIKATGKFGGVMRAVTLLENLPAKLEWKNMRLLRENDGATTVEVKDAPTATYREPRWLLVVTAAAINFIHE